MQESRHDIKTRMLKNAARAWGYTETQAENSFDPLVSMLLSACSAELEKINGEIQLSQARVLQRMVQLLSPEVLTGALPAHAVACALPVEKTTELTAGSQMYTRERVAAETGAEDPEYKDVFFSPTASFRLNRASIRYMVAGNRLYRMSNTVSKEIVAHSDRENESPSTLWLAIDEPGVSLDNTLFYFDCRNAANSNLFYHQLPKASWYIETDKLQHLPGYGLQEISGENPDLNSILNSDYNISSRVNKNINSFYKPYFITLIDPEGITSGKEPYVPVPIRNAFDHKEVQLLQKEPLRWLRIQFSETISNNLLQDVVCSTNCFPVSNTRLHQMNYRLQEIINIIPLPTEDLFFDLEQVSEDEGKMLKVCSFNKNNEEAFTLLMRNGGVGRFDERDAAAVTDYLLQLLRDDSAAFSLLGNDFMNSELKQLRQIINKLEQRLFTKQVHSEQTPYLMVTNNVTRPWHNLFISYWSTNGKDGNNIKAGTALQLYKGGALDSNMAWLVTTTIGGRNKLSTTESVLAYKSALLSKDRLITPEDIKAFCNYQLGERVVKIEIKKGVMIHPDEQQGFTRTIDVLIVIHKKSFDDMAENGELAFWPDNLKLLLEQKSAALMPYRIIIKKQAA